LFRSPLHLHVTRPQGGNFATIEQPAATRKPATYLSAMTLTTAANAIWLQSTAPFGVLLVSLPWVVRLGIWPTPAQLAVLAAFGALQMAVPYLCLIRGLRGIGSQEAVALGLLEPVLMPLWVCLVWGEQPACWTVVGAMLILAGLGVRYSR
jgi:drug/metabolite transporter (DMT)-like permease